MKNHIPVTQVFTDCGMGSQIGKSSSASLFAVKVQSDILLEAKSQGLA